MAVDEPPHLSRPPGRRLTADSVIGIRGEAVESRSGAALWLPHSEKELDVGTGAARVSLLDGYGPWMLCTGKYRTSAP